MSLTSDATKDNSTYINLILDPNIDDLVVPVDTPTSVKVDITKQVLDAINGFAPYSIVGVEYQIEGNYGGTDMLYSANDIRDLVGRIDVILNAAMVNEKQKAAVSQMIHSSASRIISDKRNNYLSRALSLIDESKRRRV